MLLMKVLLATMIAGVSASSPNHILGSDNATDLAAGTFDGTGNLDIGFGSSEHDPIDVMSHMATTCLMSKMFLKKDDGS